jgi:hypothetical protein
VLGLVAWRAAAGLVRFAGELVETPFAERRRAWSSSVEERLRAARGAEADLWLALVPHLDPRGELYVSYREDARGRELFRGLQRLRALVCPTLLRGLPYAQGKAPPAVDDARERLVLDLDSGRPEESFGGVTVLAAGSGYRLLRIEGGSEAR